MSHWLYEWTIIQTMSGIIVKAIETEAHSNSFCAILGPCLTLGTLASSIFFYDWATFYV